MPNMHEVATSVLSENMLASKEAHDAMDDNIVTVSEQYVSWKLADLYIILKQV